MIEKLYLSPGNLEARSRARIALASRLLHNGIGKLYVRLNCLNLGIGTQSGHILPRDLQRYLLFHARQVLLGSLMRRSRRAVLSNRSQIQHTAGHCASRIKNIQRTNPLGDAEPKWQRERSESLRSEASCEPLEVSTRIEVWKQGRPSLGCFRACRLDPLFSDTQRAVSAFRQRQSHCLAQRKARLSGRRAPRRRRLLGPAQHSGQQA
jgi:hypothetical protein